MTSYLVLLRGINVGGKNKVPMADLRACLEAEGFEHVSTYIQSGNVLLRSKLSAAAVAAKVEACLPAHFRLDSEIIKVLALSLDQLEAVVAHKPRGFGDHPEIYHSDALFLIGLEAAEVMPIFTPREGVDTIWQGDGVIYSQRLSAERTKSRLGRMTAFPAYKSMTIRSWGTTVKLLELLRQLAKSESRDGDDRKR